MAIDPIFAAFIALHYVSMLITVIRLGYRVKRRQLWWDDLWALLAIVGTVFIIMLYTTLGLRKLNTFPAQMQSFFTWMSYLSSPTAMWSARLSILLTIIKVLPFGTNRNVARASFIVMFFLWVGVLLSKVFMCGVPVPTNLVCDVPRKTTALTLTLNIVSVVWLVALPAFRLYRVKSALAYRNFMVACVTAGLCLIAVDVAHAVNLINAEAPGRVANYQALNISGNLQVILSMLASNIVVFITYMFSVDSPVPPPPEFERSSKDSASI
ncbi:hypothetical protein FA15DRAFT_374536 [Coprinopsis marcescibilis]|uniref:Rhodopsin domain-containing protein n=1 Tax=Coprinopsis marcescibilis TaxID=230819 RepID=A0A5C3KA40_COPMA|nr:hypothetical protein FA15DRAFT_374536 [Coprinopsis marcescibilis]